MAAYSLWCASRNAKRRFQTLTLLVGLLMVGVNPARAAVDYCSVDPLIKFQRTGISSTWIMDVQVMVPVAELPLRSPAKLEVKIPSNVTAKVVNPTLPPFRVDVRIVHVSTGTSSTPYPVTLTLNIPKSDTAFPIRLAITNPHTLVVKVVEGVAGKPLVVPLKIG